MTFRPYSQLTASGLADSRLNNTGTNIPKGTPVRVNPSTGEIDFINVSVEDEAINISGVASTDIANGVSANVVNSGIITDLNTSASYGDLMYVSKTGSLTNVKPSTGVNGFVAGDFVILVGVIAKNQNDPLKKDLILNIDIVGQL